MLGRRIACAQPVMRQNMLACLQAWLQECLRASVSARAGRDVHEWKLAFVRVHNFVCMQPGVRSCHHAYCKRLCFPPFVSASTRDCVFCGKRACLEMCFRASVRVYVITNLRSNKCVFKQACFASCEACMYWLVRAVVGWCKCTYKGACEKYFMRAKFRSWQLASGQTILRASMGTWQLW
jgi:hypothetical protein